MEFRILGAVEVVDGDRVVALPRAKHRALLALLVLNPRTAVSTDRLIEDLWDGRPPPAARQALQNYVNQLREILGTGLLLTEPRGYRLAVTPEQTDLGRFELELARARTAGSAEERAPILRAALALWRGEPFADLDGDVFAVERSVLLERCLSARLDLIDDELALGHHTHVLGDLVALSGENPRDGRVCAQLMRAFYRSGRQDAALAAYETTRVALDEIGLEPDPELKALHRRILNHDPSELAPRRPPDGAEPQRKTVTVLFAGLAEPSDAGALLDPERMTALADLLAGVVAGAAERHGGTAERLADGSMLAVFGVRTSHEDDALRAVRAATETREALAEARVGIATGEVLVRGEGTVTGAPISAARRLEQTAGPGEILLGASTLRLVHGAVTAEPVGADSSAGDAPAVRLLELDAGAPPIPRRLDMPLVGRASELAELLEAFESTRTEGRSRVVSVAGEAGIGKTRLATGLCDAVADEATVLVGRCVSYGEAAAYLPVLELVEQAGDELDTVLAGAASIGEEHLRLRAYFESLAADRPVVLVVDDAHWAEPATLDLIESFGAHAVAAPILVLCLARPDLLDTRPDWAIDTVLSPLGADETIALLEQIPGEADRALRARIAGLAEGNPLYAEQLLAYSGQGGALESVPPSVEALLASRIDRLRPADRSVLQRAAVIGRDFDARAVALLAAPEGNPTVDACLAELAGAGLLRRTSRRGWRFEHALIREVAYAALQKADRGELHQRLADFLDREDEAPDELVGYHLEQAYRYATELGTSDGASRRLARDAGTRLGAAGLRAWKRGDTPAAANLLGRATTLLPEHDPVRLELRCELGVALRAAGELEQADDVLSGATAAAAAAHDRRAELRARLELANVRLLRDPGDRAAELLAAAEEAIPVFEAVDDDHALTRAWRLRAYVEGAWKCSYALSVSSAERALEHCEKSGWSTAACLGDLAAALYHGPAPVELAIRRCRELLGEADLGGRANVLVHLGGLEAMLGRVADGRRHALRSKRLYEDLGQPALGHVNCDDVLGTIELLGGNPATAAQVFRASCEALEAMGERAYLATRATRLAEALYLTGERDEAERWSRLAEETAAPDDLPTQYLWRSIQAKLLAASGTHGAAETLALEARDLAERTDALNQRAHVTLDLAEVLRHAGRNGDAKAATQEALALFEEKGNVRGAARVRRLLAD